MIELMKDFQRFFLFFLFPDFDAVWLQLLQIFNHQVLFTEKAVIKVAEISLGFWLVQILEGRLHYNHHLQAFQHMLLSQGEDWMVTYFQNNSLFC